MAKKFRIIIFVLLFILVSSFLAVTGARADIKSVVEGQLNDLNEVGLPGGVTHPADPVVQIVRYFLGFLALVFLVLVIYAGFKWMTAGGNEETITKAKKIISSALIGLMIIFLSYAITAFVFNVILQSRTYV